MKALCGGCFTACWEWIVFPPVGRGPTDTDDLPWLVYCVPRQLRNLSHYFQQITSNRRDLLIFLTQPRETRDMKLGLRPRSNKFNSHQAGSPGFQHPPSSLSPSAVLGLSAGEAEALAGWQWFKDVSPALPPPSGRAGESPQSAWVVACKISTGHHSSSSLKHL